METILASDAIRTILFIILFTTHWCLAGFSQSFVWHRLSTHGNYTMSSAMKKFFIFFSWLCTGSSFTRPWEYTVQHLEHHSHSDKPGDPHDTSSIWRLFISTQKSLKKIRRGEFNRSMAKKAIRWDNFEVIAASKPVRLAWVVLYVYIYWLLAVPQLWILLPVTIWISLIQGSLVNKYGHSGHRGHHGCKASNMTSWLAILFLAGEAMHEDHHDDQTKPWIGENWRKDSTFVIALILHIFRVIKINRINELKL
ncbi:fatty acid desaturase [Candidatus Berkelbacteria bacterium]|nr:fatty acid desaturase [Candidatus Berkelbacteria bacterium]